MDLLPSVDLRVESCSREKFEFAKWKSDFLSRLCQFALLPKDVAEIQWKMLREDMQLIVMYPDKQEGLIVFYLRPYPKLKED